MKDMRAHLEKLRAQTAECETIRDLATDLEKRELFARLALHFKTLAGKIETGKASQPDGGVRPPRLIICTNATGRARTDLIGCLFALCTVFDRTIAVIVLRLVITARPVAFIGDEIARRAPALLERKGARHAKTAAFQTDHFSQ
jgi:hypothetical protein